ncbi:hypothetical protein ACFVTM_01510 [Arthrobacter sp. NPDC058130]|uniref:hypothetical protein n=1 Tax=Arthrobacter sp. NPDC058130 TaxID=3346353 RepID=UPI0036E104FC
MGGDEFVVTLGPRPGDHRGRPGAFRALSDYGYDAAQGFFMSRPVPAAELDAWLAVRRQHPPQTGLFSILYPGSTAI